MDSVAFNALVTELETVSRRDPSALKRRVRFMVGLGYGYVFFILALLLALLAVCVWIAWAGRGYAAAFKLAIIPLALIGIVLKALWVKIPEPTGRVVTRHEAPRLFQRVEQIRRKLKSPKADVVLLTNDFNAAVTQVPRLGIFGWERNYLIIGLPLMYAVAPKHLDAVLAHEFGHISGAHPKFGLWVGRVGRTFGGILEQFEQKNWLTEMSFGRFFRWYVPRLTAHSYAMSRNDEYAADRDSATVSGARASGEALASIEVRGRRYGHFWEELGKRMEHEPTAPAETWSAIPAWFKSGEELPERVEWLDEAMSREGLVDETHPALRARLKALKVVGERPAPADVLIGQLVPPVTQNAAEFYLGALAVKQLKEWDKEWHREGAKEWEARHKALNDGRGKVDAIIARELAGETLPVEDVWKVALALGQLEGDKAALPWLERVVRDDPKNGAAHFLLGRARLANRDVSGIELVQKAMALDVQSVPAATELLRQYHASLGDKASAVAVEIASDAHYDRLNKTNEERSGVERKDKLKAPTLSPADRAAFLKAAQVKGVKRIWIGQKITKFDQDRPLLVVVVEAKRKFLGGYDQQMGEEIWERIPQHESRDLILLAMDDSIGWLRTRIRKAGGLCADPKKGTIAPKPVRWFEMRKRSYALAAVGVAVVAFAAWTLYAPRQIADPHQMIATRQRDGWSSFLAGVRNETDVELRVLVDTGITPAELRSRMDRHAEDISLGSGTQGRGVLIGVDATNGTVLAMSTPAASPFVPEAFLNDLSRSVRPSKWSGLDPIAHIIGAARSVNHRLREASFSKPVPYRGMPAPDSLRVVVDSINGYYVPTWGPLQMNVARDSLLEHQLGPTPTAEEAYATFQQWLTLSVYVPRAQFLTLVSRGMYASSIPMTPLLWDTMRYQYATRPLKVVTRGDLAVAYSTEDALIPPLFFRRNAAGWQMDAQAEGDNTEELLDNGGFTWTLKRSGQAHDLAFDYLMIRIGDGIWRFKDGANTRIGDVR